MYIYRQNLAVITLWITFKGSLYLFSSPSNFDRSKSRCFWATWYWNSQILRCSDFFRVCPWKVKQMCPASTLKGYNIRSCLSWGAEAFAGVGVSWSNWVIFPCVLSSQICLELWNRSVWVSPTNSVRNPWNSSCSLFWAPLQVGALDTIQSWITAWFVKQTFVKQSRENKLEQLEHVWVAICNSSRNWVRQLLSMSYHPVQAKSRATNGCCFWSEGTLSHSFFQPSLMMTDTKRIVVMHIFFCNTWP